MTNTMVLRTLSVVLLAVGALAATAPAQETATITQGSGQSAAVTSDSSSPTVSGSNSFWGGGLGAYGLPDLFAGHLIGHFSIGQNRDNGILNGHVANAGISSLSYTDVSTGFAYDLRRRRSDYAVDYRGTARHYSQFSNLDVLTHDLGLSQSLLISPRVNWNLDHRFNMTPDLAGSLMAETLARQLSFINPLPMVAVFGAGMAGQSAFLNPLPVGATIIPKGFHAATSAAEGLLTLRSMRMSNLSNAALTFDATAQTKLSLNMGFSRQRFQDRNLFGTNQYNLSAGFSRLLTPRNSMSLSLVGTRLDMAQVFQQTTNAGIQIGFTRQLGRRSIVSLEFGPGQTRVDSQQSIVLPALIADLLGRKSLVRDTARSTIGWLGAAGFRTTVHNTGIHLGYNRSITDSGGLAGASLTETGTVSVSKALGQRTNVMVSLSYSHMQMLGVQVPLNIDQQALMASFTRQLSRNLDFSTLFNYAKSMRGGLHGPTLLDHNLVGIRLTYFFHRLNPGELGM